MNPSNNINNDNIFGPRIGLYYGIIIDQEKLSKKVDPLDISAVVGDIIKVSPYDTNAIWKLDYDKSQNYDTLVIYHKEYSYYKQCKNYNGGWLNNISTTPIPQNIRDEMRKISLAIELYLRSYINEDDSVTIASGYTLVYFSE